MRTLLLLCVVFLAGCTTTPEKEIVYETKTVTRLPPGELLVLPEKVEPIVLETATEADVAGFLKQLWNRNVQLESNIIGIAEFFENTNEVPDEAQKD